MDRRTLWLEDWVLMGQGKGKPPTPVTSGSVEGQTRDFLGALIPKALVVFRKGDFKVRRRAEV